MKKWLYYLVGILIVAVFGNGTSVGKDVGKLQPIQVVCLSWAENQVKIWTDTGDEGTGIDLAQAVEDLKAAAAAEIFLETADFLLVTKESVALLEDVAVYLRPSCSICLMEGEPDMKQVGRFLNLHSPQTTLMEFRSGERSLQTLKTMEGRMNLVS